MSPRSRPLDSDQLHTAQLIRSLLPNLPQEECVLVASVCPVRTVAARETVYRQGNSAEDAVLILRGLLRATAQSSKGEHSLNVIRRGELCGEAALFALDTVRAASVHAVEASTLLELTPAALDQLSGTHFLAWLQSSLLMSTARRLRTNRLAIRKAWSLSTTVEPPTGPIEPVSLEEESAPVKPASWWDALRSSLKSLA